MATKDIPDQLVLEAFIEARRLEFLKWPYEILSEKTGQCEKVCYRAMERADRRGYIESGVSLRTGWLTDKGKAFLADCGMAVIEPLPYSEADRKVLDILDMTTVNIRATLKAVLGSPKASEFPVEDKLLSRLANFLEQSAEEASQRIFSDAVTHGMGSYIVQPDGQIKHVRRDVLFVPPS